MSASQLSFPSYAPYANGHAGGGYQNGYPSMAGGHAGGSYQNGYPSMSIPGGNNSSFAFKKRFEKVDWKKIASADVDNIARNLDFHALQENIMNVTFCNIESEVDTRLVDPNFLKLFKLAQLTIEYLLHSQDYLSSAVVALEDKLKKAVEQHKETTKSLEQEHEEMGEVKKECHKRKKMIMAQQQIIQAGANSYNKCPYCAKAFINATFLQSHMARRHTEHISSYNSILASQVQQVAPPQAPPNNHSTSMGSINQDLERDLEDIKGRLRLTESQLVDERNARNAASQREKETQAQKEEDKETWMEDWKDDQLEKHKKEMEDLREMFMHELKEMNEKYASSEESMAKAQLKYSRQSNLGNLRDDVEGEKALLQVQREEVAMLKEQLNEQVNRVEEEMHNKFEEQDQVYKSKIKTINKQHRKTVNQLSATLENSLAEYEKSKQTKGELAEEYEQRLQEMQKVLKNTQESERRLQLEEEALERLALHQQPDVMEKRPDANVEKRVQIQETTAGFKQRPPEPALISAADSLSFTSDFTGSVTGSDTVDQMMPPVAPPRQSFYGASDDDEDDDDTTTGLNGASTLGTTTLGATISLPDWGTGTLSQTDQHSVRLVDEMRNNPRLLDAMKNELRNILSHELEKRGVSKEKAGLSDAVFNSKMDLLKAQRQITAKKHRNFYDLRQTYINAITQLAKEKVKEQKKAQGAQRSGGQPTAQSQGQRRPRSAGSPRRERGGPSARPVSSPLPAAARSPQSTPSAARGGTKAAGPAPKPAPRSASPTGKMSSSRPTSAPVLSSQDTATSSHWDSDEDDSDEEDYTETAADDVPTATAAAAAAAARGSYTVPRAAAGPPPAAGRSGSAAGRAPPAAARPLQNQADDDDDDDSDNWGDVSELEAVSDPSARSRAAAAARPAASLPAPTRSTSTPKTTASSPSPKGPRVAQMSRSIELQMQGHGGRKPAGGINTLSISDDAENTSQRKKANRVSFDDEIEDESDSLPSVSSVEGDNFMEPPQYKKKPTPVTRSSTRSSAQDTSHSTNTYNTSAWGTSSKAASTAPGQDSHKTSSGYDWDSASDYDDDTK